MDFIKFADDILAMNANIFLLGAYIVGLPCLLFELGMFIAKSLFNWGLYVLRTKDLVHSLRSSVSKLPKEATKSNFAKVRQGTHIIGRKKKYQQLRS